MSQKSPSLQSTIDGVTGGGSNKPEDDDIKNGNKVRNNTGETEEIGGRTGPDPTRYGDWEKDGRCIDF
jgi:hypothetical protein